MKLSEMEDPVGKDVLRAAFALFLWNEQNKENLRQKEGKWNGGEIGGDIKGRHSTLRNPARPNYCDWRLML